MTSLNFVRPSSGFCPDARTARTFLRKTTKNSYSSGPARTPSGTRNTGQDNCRQKADIGAKRCRHLLHKFWLHQSQLSFLELMTRFQILFHGFSHGYPLPTGRHAPQTLAAPSRRDAYEKSPILGKRCGKLGAQVLRPYVIYFCLMTKSY